MSGDDNLRQLVEELQESVRARDEFLAIAAHELRNPMHSLLLRVSATLKEAHRRGDPKLIEMLEGIKLAVDRYVQRANFLLDVSRINAGHLRLRIEDVDLVMLVRDIAKSYEPEAEFNRVTLNLDLPPALKGRWDRVALEQVVGNLISNAVKFGAGSPVVIKLVCIHGDTIQLTVKDYGIGISAADQARIFERFEQVVSNHSRVGFGLGLWLVRSLVEAHGGTIAVESALEQGSTFTVHLPLHVTSGALSHE